VRRWPASWAEAFDAFAGALLSLLGVLIGLASERSRFGWDDFRHWLPDLAVGLVFIGCGVDVVKRNRGTGLLLASVGFAWFLANFQNEASYVHRGPIIHLLIAFPGWRPRSTLDLIAVVSGYVSCAALPVWNSGQLSIALVCGLVGVVAIRVAGAPSECRRFRQTAMWSTVVFAAVVVAGGIARLSVGAFRVPAAFSLAYEIALCAVALMLTVGSPTPGALSLVNLVVELGDRRSATVRDALASTLGDPLLRIGYWDHRSQYLDADGHVVDIPNDRTRMATFVSRHGDPSVVVVHDAATFGKSALAESVSAATRLSSLNDELHATVRSQLAELSASRRRLVSAADEERRRLDDRLRLGAEQHLRELYGLLEQNACCEATSTDIDGILDHLTETIEDLRELASGLHPRELSDGLPQALESLAARCPLPVEVEVDVQDGAIDEAKSTAVYYVCAEALANALKHAVATSVTMRIIVSNVGVLVEVTDDGRGGAEPRRGSGLRGLIDRVEALDGTLRTTSPAGGGTRIVVELPNAPSGVARSSP
jgi:signal transduction histidine kinase